MILSFLRGKFNLLSLDAGAVYCSPLQDESPTPENCCIALRRELYPYSHDAVTCSLTCRAPLCPHG